VTGTAGSDIFSDIAVQQHLSPMKSVPFARLTGLKVFFLRLRDGDGELTIPVDHPVESRAGRRNFC